MTETVAPARRRRYACVIALAAELVGECSAAALRVYAPIAKASPRQQNVPVYLDAIRDLAITAGRRFDAAVAEDAARWPAAVSQEDAESKQTFARRCVTREAERIIEGAKGDGTPDDLPGTIRLPELAAMDLIAAGGQFLEVLERDPAEIFVLLDELAEDGDLPAGQVLVEAVHTAILGAVLLLQNAADEDDPSTAAELILNAARAFVTVVTVASIDVDGESAK
ncbi:MULTISPECIES: hypothetical protein [unclassified Streptomyces]|uniref:hypothetical protein n=1 Tax=unclassified Streptomyces TaxID=2593676 RepID=UPI0033F7DD13